MLPVESVRAIIKLSVSKAIGGFWILVILKLMVLFSRYSDVKFRIVIEFPSGSYVKATSPLFTLLIPITLETKEEKF
jgi:hypothetical protein